jgi:hypothetical protein
MKPSEEAFYNILIDQATRHVTNIPHFEGMVVGACAHPPNALKPHPFMAVPATYRVSDCVVLRA